MVDIDREELEKMSKSDFGKYNNVSESRLLKILYKLFLEPSMLRATTSGAITAAVIVYSIFTKNNIPVFIWFGYLVIINIGGYFYWRHEQKRLAKDLVNTEDELNNIRKEIKERQSYFEDLKKKIETDNNSANN